MYVAVSRYKQYTRVRILRKVKAAGKWFGQFVEHIGSAHTAAELAVLRTKATQRLTELQVQLSLFDKLTAQATTGTQRLVVSGSVAYGLWRVLGGLYDRIGFPDDLLKYLVVARIALPKSKLATVRYLRDHLGLGTSLSAVYRYMDQLDQNQLTAIMLTHAQRRAVQKTGRAIAVVFYDVTTLYFETDEDDEDTDSQLGLRKKGYSKDHRYDLPQIVVGLTVDETGFPLDFQVYDGNTYEGKTLLDGVRSIQRKLKLDPATFTVVADAGMLSEKNLQALEQAGYSYIVGARIRSASTNVVEQIVGWDYAAKGHLTTTVNGRRLLVTHSDKRAKRSQQNRDRLVRRLQAKLNRGQVVKKSKYVRLDTEQSLTGTIDQTKLDQDQRFDGLKGYVTNTTLTADEVIARYASLWHVEKSFRMSKSDLRARPTFHYKRRRIVAHLAICVCALGVLREFEAKVQQYIPDVGLTLTLEQLLMIREYHIRLPNQQETTIYSELTETQERLLRI